MWMRKSHHRLQAGLGVGFFSCSFVLWSGPGLPLFEVNTFSLVFFVAVCLCLPTASKWIFLAWERQVLDDCPGLLVHVLGIVFAYRC